MAVNGSSKKAAWIMPVPSTAKVELGDDAVFGRLSVMTQHGESLSGVTPPLRLTFASDRIVYPMRLSKGAATAQTVTLYVAAAHRVDATTLPEPGVTPELLFAGRVEDEALAKPADYLTAYSVTYNEPSRITDDFTFTQAVNDDGYQRFRCVTRNEGFWSTVGVLFGGLLLLGGGAAVIARVVVRRSSTGRA